MRKLRMNMQPRPNPQAGAVGGPGAARVAGRLSVMDRAAAFADALPLSFWLDDPAAPEPALPLVGATRADLVSSAVATPGCGPRCWPSGTTRPVTSCVLESDRCGWAASGRNGGFCAASLTHGLANGVERFPDEVATLERLGRENLDAIGATVAAEGIECDFERTGELDVATEPHQVAWLREAEALAHRHGGHPVFLGRDELQAEIHSPTFLAGLWEPDSCALVNPARLAWGLRAACERAGVRIHEHTRVEGLAPAGLSPGRPHGGAHHPRDGDGLPGGTGHQRLALPGAAAAQVHRPGLRLRADDRAAHPGPERGRSGGSAARASGPRGTSSSTSGAPPTTASSSAATTPSTTTATPWARPSSSGRPPSSVLSALFAETFPALEDVRFTHAWAGAIDTCSRFCAFFDRSFDGRVASAAGYTGLGVGASRFGARVALDLVSGHETELTRLAFVRSKPIPFPPEPVRSIGINLTRWSLARADAHQGRRNLWLRALDRVGLGFDS